ncbi:MAG TPA: HAD-IIA family hydrolase [Phycisphaerae bacterium]|nr:HAD-IIA family hydrolase [Phycisphaerae bacterium]HOJ73666.1 HAD-IIA family hydrolase [Phycisphaerae bacterium]HOM50313.1 HAD-IIA family hydrolase [Phycisphaerae bacterium]HON65732.1 HAD-IIA family hydrolase [Phycisphaerae bacterium]HOQ84845.1 HAD-IIA family hydrolase [Phycisphaerae bacterium]
MPHAKLKSIRHLVLDMDGTIYLGRTLFPFTPAFFDCLRRLGIEHTFITNNCSISVDEYLLKLKGMGIEASRDQLYTSALSTLDYLRREMPSVRRLYVLGTPSLAGEFAAAGYSIVAGEEEPEAVVISFDTGLTFERLGKAAWWVRQGKPFIATHPDQTCPTDRPTVLVDCGSICECLHAATGRRPQAVLGKPSPLIVQAVLERHGLQPAELAVVGDRLNTDMALARAAGVTGVLVLSGGTRREDLANAALQPDIVVENVGELGQLLTTAREKAG